MSDPLPTSPSHAHDAARELDRDAKIEQLLLAGLDHYFASEHEQAINVWTRALFLDRSHPRARAYIERARSALAELQRESEELLHSGVAAFERGDGEEARRLLHIAMSRGAPPDEALAVLDRLNRLEAGANTVSQAPAARVDRRTVVQASGRGSEMWARLSVWVAVLVLVALAGVALARSIRDDWRSLLAVDEPQQPQGVATTAPDIVEPPPAMPRRAETALARAKALDDSGRLRDALAALNDVRLTDPELADADHLRADIQRQLLALAAPSNSPGPAIGNGDTHRP